MKISALVLLPLASLLGLATARSSTGDRVLVVLEPQIDQADYSKLWSSLRARGYDLTFKGPKDESAELLKFGEAQYDHLILYAPSTKAFSQALSPKSVVQAQFAGLNTLHLLNANISELNRDTFREYDLEFSDRDSMLIDAFSHPADASGVSTVLLPAPETLVRGNGPLVSPETLSAGPLVYPRGAVHTAGLNPYLIEVLHGTKTSYVGEDASDGGEDDEDEVEGGAAAAALVGGKKGAAAISGRRATLVSAMQTRDNVRVGFVGSGEMFSDKWWDASVKSQDGVQHTTSNGLFAEDLTRWLFQETGVVKIVSSTHHRKGETSPREMYRIKDDLTFSLTLSEYTTSRTKNESSWSPFHASDMQLDFTMLDPHVRTALHEERSLATRESSTFSTTFRAPDKHGVFKFVVEYWRPGWSYVRTSSTASVVPFRHDEYPRFITGAWPFYSSTISASVAFVLFCAVWVSLAESDKSGSAKGKKKSE